MGLLIWQCYNHYFWFKKPRKLKMIWMVITIVSFIRSYFVSQCPDHIIYFLEIISQYFNNFHWDKMEFPYQLHRKLEACWILVVGEDISATIAVISLQGLWLIFFFFIPVASMTETVLLIYGQSSFLSRSLDYDDTETFCVVNANEEYVLFWHFGYWG